MPLASLRRIWSPDWIPIFLAQGFGVTCGLVGVRLISAWVPPDELGLYGLCLALAPAGAVLTHHGLARHAARHWPLTGDPRAYQEALIESARKASLLLAFLLALGLAGVASVSELPYAPSLPWLLLSALTGAYGAILHAVLQTSRAYWMDCAVSCTNSIVRTGGPLVAVLAAGATAPVLLAGFALPQAMLLAAAWWGVLGRRLGQPQPGRSAAPAPTTAEMDTYGRSFWVVGACMLIGGAQHRLWASICLDATELGYFTLAGNLAFVLPNVLSAALSQFLSPRLFARARFSDGQPDSSWLRTVEGSGAAFVSAALAGSYLLQWVAPWLLGLLIDPSYSGSVPYLFANGAYAAALALGHLYQLPAIAAGRPRAARRSMLGLALVLATGSGATALYFPDSYMAWLSLSPLAAILWLAFSARVNVSS